MLVLGLDETGESRAASGRLDLVRTHLPVKTATLVTKSTTSARSLKAEAMATAVVDVLKRALTVRDERIALLETRLNRRRDDREAGGAVMRVHDDEGDDIPSQPNDYSTSYVGQDVACSSMTASACAPRHCGLLSGTLMSKRPRSVSRPVYVIGC